MKITAITRYKQGDVFLALKRLNWTQAELSRRTGICVQTINSIINLRIKPKKEHADKIQKAFGEKGIFLDVTECWPETFKGFSCKREETRDIDPNRLIENPEVQQLIIDKEERKLLDEAISTLTDREQTVLRLRILDDDLTLEAVGHKMKLHKEHIRQIEAKALRKLRHPKRIAILREFASSVLPQAFC